jgi:cell division protease FtsH
VSTGAINDLERVTKRAYAMVAYFGMSDNLPNLSYYDSTGHSDYGFTKPYSERTAELIDSEAKEIVAGQYKRAKKILKENAEGHARLSALLLEREVIFSEDLEAIFGKRPWASRHDELILQNGDDETDLLPESAESAETTVASVSTETEVENDTTKN